MTTTIRCGAILSGLGAAFLSAGAFATVGATTLALWTFETSLPLTAGPHAAEGGLLGGDAFGEHAAKAAAYSNPVGNGSFESFSSNNWAPDDAYVFITSTLGYETISFGWSQTRSGTGPGSFVAEWSADGKAYQTIAEYTIEQITWMSGTLNEASVFGPFTLPEGASDLDTLWVRLRATVGGSGTAGTNRIDDVIVAGFEIETGGCLPGEPCGPDLNGDGSVGAADLAILLGAWGTDNAAADLDGDGTVGAADLAILLGAWSI